MQGPKSREILQRLTGTDLSDAALPYYSFLTGVEMAGIPAQVSRIGYTAELGFEVLVAADRAVPFWDALFEAGSGDGLLPAGAAAVMMCRIEAGMIMGELEYDETMTPYECRMGWAVDLGKEEFQGKSALARARDSPSVDVVSVVLSGEGEYDGAPLTVDGERVGHVTMAVPSPHLGGRFLGLARVDVKHAAPGSGPRCRCRRRSNGDDRADAGLRSGTDASPPVVDLPPDHPQGTERDSHVLPSLRRTAGPRGSVLPRRVRGRRPSPDLRVPAARGAARMVRRARRLRLLGRHPPRGHRGRQPELPAVQLAPGHPDGGDGRRRAGGPADHDGARPARAHPPSPVRQPRLRPPPDRDLRATGAGHRDRRARPGPGPRASSTAWPRSRSRCR